MASDRDTQIERIAAALATDHQTSKVHGHCTWSDDHRPQAVRLYDAGLRVEPDAGALRAAIEEELALLPPEAETSFSRGCAAAYNYVLSLLAIPSSDAGAAEPRAGA